MSYSPFNQSNAPSFGQNGHLSHFANPHNKENQYDGLNLGNVVRKGNFNIYKPPINHSPSAPLQTRNENVQQNYSPFDTNRETYKDSYLDRIQGLPFLDGITTNYENLEESEGGSTKRTKTRITTKVITPNRERVVDPPYFNVQTGDQQMRRRATEPLNLPKQQSFHPALSQIQKRASSPRGRSRSRMEPSRTPQKRPGPDNYSDISLHKPHNRSPIQESAVLIDRKNEEEPIFKSMARPTPENTSPSFNHSPSRNNPPSAHLQHQTPPQPHPQQQPQQMDRKKAGSEGKFRFMSHEQAYSQRRPPLQQQEVPQMIQKSIDSPPRDFYQSPHTNQVKSPEQQKIEMSNDPEHLKMMSYQIPVFQSPPQSPQKPLIRHSQNQSPMINSPHQQHVPLHQHQVVMSPPQQIQNQPQPIFIAAPSNQPIFQIPTHPMQQMNQVPQLMSYSPMKMMAAQITPQLPPMHVSHQHHPPIIEVVEPVFEHHHNAPPSPDPIEVPHLITHSPQTPHHVHSSPQQHVQFSPQPQILYQIPPHGGQPVPFMVHHPQMKDTAHFSNPRVVHTPKKEYCRSPTRQHMESPISHQPSQQTILFAVPLDQIGRIQNGQQSLAQFALNQTPSHPPSPQQPEYHVPQAQPISQMPMPMPMPLIQQPPMTPQQQHHHSINQGTPRSQRRPSNPMVMVSPPQNQMPHDPNMIYSIATNDPHSNHGQSRFSQPQQIRGMPIQGIQSVPTFHRQPQFVHPSSPMVSHSQIEMVPVPQNVMIDPRAQHPRSIQRVSQLHNYHQGPPPGHVVIASPQQARGIQVARTFSPSRAKRLSFRHHGPDSYNDHHPDQQNQDPQFSHENDFVVLPTIDIAPQSVHDQPQSNQQQNQPQMQTPNRPKKEFQTLEMPKRRHTSPNVPQYQKPQQKSQTLSDHQKNYDVPSPNQNHQSNETPARVMPSYKKADLGPNPYYDDQNLHKMNSKRKKPEISITPATMKNEPTSIYSTGNPLDQNFVHKNKQNATINVLSPNQGEEQKISTNSYRMPHVDLQDFRLDSMEELPDVTMKTETTVQPRQSREKRSSSNNVPQSMVMDDQGNMYMLVKPAPMGFKKAPTMVNSYKVGHYQVMSCNSGISGNVNQ